MLLGSHLLKHWASTQKRITLSSGEAELGAVVRGFTEALGIQSYARDLGAEFELEVHADSSAAIGICRRSGIGKVRHLAVMQLWVQELVSDGRCRWFKVLGTDNLFVVDGASIPGSSGAANPSLTIGANAERMMEQIIAEHIR